MIEKNELPRRTFFKRSGVLTLGSVAAGSALLTGCENPDNHLIPPKKEVSKGPEVPKWLGVEPQISEKEIKGTLDTDVLIIGAGASGLHAARAASEKGARVIVIEKAGRFQVRSGQYGTLGNKYQRQVGITYDKHEAINEHLKQMGYRADQRVWNYWADHSGEDFDWMIDLAPAVHFMFETDTQLDRNKINLMLMHYPLPAAYDRSKENSPTYPTVMTFLPSQEPMMELVYKKSIEQGTKYIFKTRAQKLLRDKTTGKMQGVIAQDMADGSYIKINAKSVILASGDYMNDHEMVKTFVPYVANFFCPFPNVDYKNHPTNTGDGHKLGSWIGAKLEDGPHAPVAHTLGGPLGVDAFLLTNAKGERFTNEDISGQQVTQPISRQPGGFGWQVFDAKFPEQVGFMGVSHGSVNHCVAPEDNPKLPPDCQWAIGKTSYISVKDLEEMPDVVKANSIEELANMLYPDNKKAQMQFLATTKRYNELCDKGHDDDFGKTAKRMFPVRHAPFYAGKMGVGASLVVMGGFTVEPSTANVLDTDYNEIAGLYACGNVMGGRFLGDYPVVLAGTSHATCLCYGRLAGYQAAANAKGKRA
ncbi:FAD-dependent oxidoreductase [Sulfurospirillum halorespirans]|uniref:Periplasmic fumarate reductase-like protein n=1 Tax=Sulfurospirillum halorespirans DSM 13726 TaxID=1193502 RepID=A0A1D7TI89_9BACT|nr:FAD-dependent oxidoreductase [Sulfurospirillum halorespirans]AOO64696.1 periplasmic fumarate reductase-like protein [Sulfurospirillum halorespirans DSM 13726]